MKNVKKLIVAALISVFAVSAVGCKMIGKTETAIKKSPVAKVNKDTITRGQLDEKMQPVVEQMKAQGIDPASQQGKDTLKQQQTQMLDAMVLDLIIKQKANELKLVPDKTKMDQEINKQLDQIKAQEQFQTNGKFDQTKFDAALKQANLTLDSLKSLISDNVIKKAVDDNIVKDVKIDDAAVKQEYDQYGNIKYTEKPNTIHLAHILCKTEDDAKKAKARLDKGEDFATVAKDMSIDTTANAQGGDLGVVNYDGSTADGNQMDATFMKAALTLAPGAISNPVQTQFGFHIIKCIEKKEYPVKKFDTVKDQIKATLLSAAQDKKVTDTYDQWKKAATIVTDKYTSNLPY